MISESMRRKIELRQFDPPTSPQTARRFDGIDLNDVYSMSDAGLSPAEIAESMGVSTQSIMYRLRRRRGSLR
jgi:hypothetical protein